MKKPHILLPSLLFVYSVAVAGIYRHDKKISEYAALAAQKQFNCVGQLLRRNEHDGSCVLIGSKYVISAAHCFKESLFRPDTISNENGQITIVNQPYATHIGNATDYSVVFNGKKYHCKAINIYPTYLDTTKRAGDMVLIELDEIVKDVTPAVINTAFDELHANVTGVGFGANCPANKPEDIVSDAKKLAGENIIDSIGGFMINNRPAIMFCDFDHPTDKERNKMGSATPRSLEYICSGGDSGGGLFRETKNGWELIGTCTGAPININELIKYGYYGQIMEWTRVSVFADWIRENEK